MGNKRKEVRENIKSFLTSAFSDSEIMSSIQTGISQTEQLPAINIVTPNETATPEAMHRQRYIRKIELRLEVRVAASSDTDDELDLLLAEVEDAVLADSTFGGAVLDSILQGTETDIGFEGNKEIGLGILIYEATYVA